MASTSASSRTRREKRGPLGEYAASDVVEQVGRRRGSGSGGERPQFFGVVVDGIDQAPLEAPLHGRMRRRLSLGAEHARRVVESA